MINTTSVFRRLSQIGLSIGLLIMVLNMWVNADQKGRQIQADNTANLTRQLAHQSTLIAKDYIKRNQLDKLTILLNNLASNPDIKQAMVYDDTGDVLAQSEGAITASTNLTQSNLDTSPVDPVTMYISEIHNDKKLIGYLRISYLQQQALNIPLKNHSAAMRQMMLMMIIAGIMGFMLTRGLSRFSRNSYRVIEKPDTTSKHLD
jgi:membrane protein